MKTIQNTSRLFARKKFYKFSIYISAVDRFNICSQLISFPSEMQYRISRIVQARQLWPWLQPDILFNCTSMARQQAKCLEILHGFTDKVKQIKYLVFYFFKLVFFSGYPGKKAEK